MNEAFWALGRGTGIVALILMTLSIVLGIVSRSGRSFAGLGRFGVNEIHRVTALTAVGLVATHVISLFFDPYAQLRIVDFFVPFLGSYRPLWLGLGTLTLDLTIIVTIVSLLRQRVGPKVFRAVHWAVYAMWPLSLAHAIGNGTNGTSSWFLAIAGACTAFVGGSLIWRLMPSYQERGQVRVARIQPSQHTPGRQEARR